MSTTIERIESAHRQRLSSSSGLIDATERLYLALFTAALSYGVVTAAWGIVIAPTNGFDQHLARTLGIGAVLILVSAMAMLGRRRVAYAVRNRPVLLAVPLVLGIAALWLDGGWRSPFFLFSYTAIPIAAVATDVRRSVLCGIVLAVGYLAGLALNGYTVDRLVALRDADSVVANTGGYLLAGYFIAAPAIWLLTYVLRINRFVDKTTAAERERAATAAEALAEGQASADQAIQALMVDRDDRLASLANAEEALAAERRQVADLQARLVRAVSADLTQVDRGTGTSRGGERLAKLSLGELEVVKLIAAEHMTNEEIARRLFLSIKAVEKRVSKALSKTGARRRGQLTAIAIREGLVPLDTSISDADDR